MRGFFRFIFRALVWVAILGGIAYAIKKLTEPPASTPAGSGVLPSEPIKSLDEASKRVVTAITDAAEVLSPEQRAAFAKQVQEHHRG